MSVRGHMVCTWLWLGWEWGIFPTPCPPDTMEYIAPSCLEGRKCDPMCLHVALMGLRITHTQPRQSCNFSVAENVVFSSHHHPMVTRMEGGIFHSQPQRSYSVAENRPFSIVQKLWLLNGWEWWISPQLHYVQRVGWENIPHYRWHRGLRNAFGGNRLVSEDSGWVNSVDN